MTRAELLERVLSGWFAIVGEFRGWNASSLGHLDRKTGLASKRVVLTFVVECVVGGGFGIPWRLTKGHAHLLIEGDPATKGQLRRLKFYKIRAHQYLTKRDAMALIDEYIQENPLSEVDYRKWKSRRARRRATLWLFVLLIAALSCWWLSRH